jgi:enoyl-CoA hydratase
MSITTKIDGPVFIVTIDRPAARNAVDRPTADALVAAFQHFDAEPTLSVAILTGAQGTFCAGADLKGIAEGRGNRIAPDGDGPMGPTRLLLKKPVIAAIEGHAVAGGLELALWCDLRVAARDAIFGVFCRRWGVPLIDGGTVRLPRIVGMGRALDLILTGRGVSGDEAVAMGLVTRLTEKGEALTVALDLAHGLARLPQHCMRNDRLSAYEQHDRPLTEALANEFRRGLDSLASDEARSGAQRFAKGAGRHGG